MYLEENKWTDKSPWYNTTISKIINGQRFEYYLKTGQKDMYYLMCYVDAYDK